jgi:putative MATE family efflux protein
MADSMKEHRVRKVAGLAAPLIAFYLIQNVVTLVFLAMVGRLGTAALAGTGISGAIFGFLVALFNGFDTGVQAVVSRSTGANAKELAGRALSDAHAVSIPFGILIAAVGFHFGPVLAHLLASDANVAAAARANLKGISPALALFAITIPFNAYWIGSGLPRIAFFVTALAVPVNIALLALFIFGAGPVPPLGLFGAGLAQCGASFFTLLLQFAIARVRRVPGLLSAPRLSGMLTIVRIGWPVSMQNSLGQVGGLIGYGIVSQLGTAATALLDVLTTLMQVPVQCATGFGAASATLVGQALGRGDAKDAKTWGWQIARAGAAIAFPVGMFVLFAPAVLLGMFLHDPRTLAMALFPARLLGLVLSAQVFSIILGFSLRGAGATKVAAGTSFTLQWALFLPVIWLVAVRLHGGFNALAVVQVSFMVIEACVFTLVWSRSRWTRIRIASLESRRNTAPAETANRTRLERVIVMGGAGAGKSTFSRALGQKLGVPVIHLDRYFFGPGWAKVEFTTVRQRVAEALVPNRWVVDGTYSDLLDLMLPQLDLIIWLEQPFFRRLYRTWRKTRIHKNRPRADRPDGAEERFTLSYVWTIMSFGRFTPSVARRLEAAAPGRVLCLRGDREAQAFLEGAAPVGAQSEPAIAAG